MVVLKQMSSIFSYSNCITCSNHLTLPTSGVGELLKLPSSFQKALCTTSWLPSSLGTVAVPSSLFLPTPEVKQLFGNLPAPLLGPKLRNKSLLDCLGVQMTITAEVRSNKHR